MRTLNDQTLELMETSTKTANEYVRVGGKYYRHVLDPMEMHRGKPMPEKCLFPWKASLIKEDHGKGMLEAVPRYTGFCYVPDHLNYQPELGQWLNLFQKPMHEPTVTAFGYTLGYLDSLFGGRVFEYNGVRHTLVDIVLDWLQLTYTRPTQRLPVLQMCSDVRAGGKSTFLKWVTYLFEPNATIIDRTDLDYDYNARWATKLVVTLDEAILPSSVAERLMEMVVSPSIILNQKGMQQAELDAYTHVVCAGPRPLLGEVFKGRVLSANSSVFWTTIPSSNAPTARLREEAPGFLNYLITRKLSTEQTGRLWFHHDLLALIAHGAAQ